MVVQPGLCGTRSEIPKTGFLASQLNFSHFSIKTKDTNTVSFMEKQAALSVITVMTLSFMTERSGQKVQTKIRLLLEVLHCLLFHLHHFDKIP